MANDPTAFMETFVAAAADYNEAVVGQLSLLDAVYKDIKPEVARAGKTINVYFPDVAPVNDQGNADWTPEDINPNYTSLVFNERPGKAILIRDFEQYITSVEIRDKFVGPMYKRCAEYLNGKIASLINANNFGMSTPIKGTTAGEVTVTDQLSAWNTLANAKVPLDDPADLSLLVHNQVYQRMLADPQWVQENIVSAAIAQRAREDAAMPNAFKFRPVWDQQMPTASNTVLQGKASVINGTNSATGIATRWTIDLTTSNYVSFGNDSYGSWYPVTGITSDNAITFGTPVGPNATGTVYQGNTGITSVRRRTVLSGTVSVGLGSTSVTGANTPLFKTQVSAGDWIIFSSDATATPYQVSATPTSDSALTLTTPYSGATAPSGDKATVQNFSSLAMHRFAIALALRPLPEPDSRVIHFRYVDIKGIPMRLMASYQHLKNGWLISLDFGYALSVIRPDFGVLIQS